MGGDINSFLAQHLKYPKQARDNGIEGSVLVSFIITDEGKVEDVSVIHSLGNGCDVEAVRVVSLMSFTPAIKDGKAVNFKFNLPLKFMINA